MICGGTITSPNNAGSRSISSAWTSAMTGELSATTSISRLSQTAYPASDDPTPDRPSSTTPQKRYVASAVPRSRNGLVPTPNLDPSGSASHADTDRQHMLL